MDAYPVTVTLADGTVHTKCKARIDGAGVAVWRWDRQARTGVEVYTSPEVTQESDTVWRSGDVVIAKAGGCGCGSALKRWQPPGPHAVVAG